MKTMISGGFNNREDLKLAEKLREEDMEKAENRALLQAIAVSLLVLIVGCILIAISTKQETLSEPATIEVVVDGDLTGPITVSDVCPKAGVAEIFR